MPPGTKGVITDILDSNRYPGEFIFEAAMYTAEGRYLGKWRFAAAEIEKAPSLEYAAIAFVEDKPYLELDLD